MKPIVIHIRQAPKGWETNPQYVYIGRPRGGKQPEECRAGEYGVLGNPIPIGPTLKGEPCVWCGKTYHARGKTLACYEMYLGWRMQADLMFRKQVMGLAGKTLICFCKPLPCHGDILAEFCEYFNQKATERR